MELIEPTTLKYPRILRTKVGLFIGRVIAHEAIKNAAQL